jgi:hypothetical protein
MLLATLSEALDEQMERTIGKDYAQDKDTQINFKALQGYRQAQAA